jgi:hypothetical protein
MLIPRLPAALNYAPTTSTAGNLYAIASLGIALAEFTLPITAKVLFAQRFPEVYPTLDRLHFDHTAGILILQTVTVLSFLLPILGMTLAGLAFMRRCLWRLLINVSLVLHVADLIAAAIALAIT